MLGRFAEVWGERYKGKCRYDGRSDVKNYLFGVARNTLNQQLRSTRKETLVKSQIRIDRDLLVEQTLQQCPAEALNTAESQNILKETIAQLPQKARQAIEYVYFDGIPAKKAAKKARCDYATFRNRLSYGL